MRPCVCVSQIRHLLGAVYKLQLRQSPYLLSRLLCSAWDPRIQEWNSSFLLKAVACSYYMKIRYLHPLCILLLPLWPPCPSWDTGMCLHLRGCSSPSHLHGPVLTPSSLCSNISFPPLPVLTRFSLLSLLLYILIHLCSVLFFPL